MNAVTKTEAAVFQQGFAKISLQVKAALPTHISYDRFERIVMMAVQRDPKLLKADQRSLFLACQKAATDGLMPDGREGALVRFYDKKLGKDTVTWMPMVYGIRKLAYNSGEIATLTAEVAYDCDKFLVIKGDEPKIVHEPNMNPPDDARMIAAYMIAKLKNGEIVREVMTRKQVLKVKAFSRSSDKGPWVEWEDEQWRKTVIRRGSKQLPLSADRDADLRMQRAIERIDEDVVLDGKAIDASAIDEAAGATRSLEAPTSKLDAIESSIGATETAHDALTGEILEGDSDGAETSAEDRDRELADRMIQEVQATTKKNFEPTLSSHTFAAPLDRFRADRRDLAEEVENAIEDQREKLGLAT